MSKKFPVLYGSVVKQDGKYITIGLFEDAKDVLNTKVEIRPVKANLTDKQRGLYRSILRWVVENGAKEHGFFSDDALHEAIKAYIASEYSASFEEAFIAGEFSTTVLPKEKFETFLEIINQDVFVNMFGIDTSKLWEEVEKHAQN